MNKIDGKVVCITGGTGSFGEAFLNKLLSEYYPKRIIIFSRDENRQHELRLKHNNPILQFEIGDVRDKARVFELLKGVDLVFHAAAMKQVPSCEFFPIEAVQTNILGTANVLDAAIHNKVEKVICLSTDKAVYPISAMGISKAMMEKTAISKARKSGDTIICITRYGNVMCSRGSIIPIFMKQAKSNSPITITDGMMTRFLLSLENAVELVVYALENGNNGEIFIKKANACSIQTLAEAVKTLFSSSSEIKKLGIRHGEKMHESLIGEEEMARTLDCGDFYKVLPDGRDLNYNIYFSEGNPEFKNSSYTSNSTTQLNLNQVQVSLLGLKEVRDELTSR